MTNFTKNGIHNLPSRQSNAQSKVRGEHGRYATARTQPQDVLQKQHLQFTSRPVTKTNPPDDA